MLDSLTPGQKQMVLAGVPVVAVFALVAGRKQKTAPASAPVAMPTNAVLGADALNSFMDQISQSIGGLQSQIDGMGAVDAAVPAPPPTATAAPTITDSTPTPPTAVAAAPSPAPSLPPGTAVVFGTAADGTPWSYGGTLAQAQAAAGEPVTAPDLATPPSWGTAGTWADPRYSWA